MGRLAAGSKLLPLPLEARVGKSPFEALNTPVDPQLTKWSSTQTRAKATVNLRQPGQVKGHGQLPQGPARHAFHGHAVKARRGHGSEIQRKEIPK